MQPEQQAPVPKVHVLCGAGRVAAAVLGMQQPLALALLLMLGDNVPLVPWQVVQKQAGSMDREKPRRLLRKQRLGRPSAVQPPELVRAGARAGQCGGSCVPVLCQEMARGPLWWWL